MNFINSGRSRNIKTRGHGPGAVEFWGLFWCPLHTYPMFCSERREHIVNIEWWLKLKNSCIIQSKLTKNTPPPKKNSNRCAGAGSHFDQDLINNNYTIVLKHQVPFSMVTSYYLYISSLRNEYTGNFKQEKPMFSNISG